MPPGGRRSCWSRLRSSSGCTARSSSSGCMRTRRPRRSSSTRAPASRSRAPASPRRPARALRRARHRRRRPVPTATAVPVPDWAADGRLNLLLIGSDAGPRPHQPAHRHHDRPERRRRHPSSGDVRHPAQHRERAARSRGPGRVSERALSAVPQRPVPLGDGPSEAVSGRRRTRLPGRDRGDPGARRRAARRRDRRRPQRLRRPRERRRRAVDRHPPQPVRRPLPEARRDRLHPGLDLRGLPEAQRRSGARIRAVAPPGRRLRADEAPAVRAPGPRSAARPDLAAAPRPRAPGHRQGQPVHHDPAGRDRRPGRARRARRLAPDPDRRALAAEVPRVHQHQGDQGDPDPGADDLRHARRRVAASPTPDVTPKPCPRTTGSIPRDGAARLRRLRRPHLRLLRHPDRLGVGPARSVPCAARGARHRGDRRRRSSRPSPGTKRSSRRARTGATATSWAAC